MEKRLEIAKNIIMEESAKKGSKVGKIILFGSRARGDYKEDSDWDFLIIVNEGLNRKEKRELSSNIRMRLVYSGSSSDIIIISNKQFLERGNDIGHIVYYALKEGLPV